MTCKNVTNGYRETKHNENVQDGKDPKVKKCFCNSC